MSVIRLSHPSGEIDGSIHLDGSKSISNRVLIINALSGGECKLEQLSTSDDTTRMDELLRQTDSDIYHVGHAGTTFRFLTAYLALQKGTQTLTGSSRMLERPIGPLVDALRELGCNIQYTGRDGYPPLQIGNADRGTLKNEVTIEAGISSQYITALILIGPTLPNGLTIHLKGELVSESYLQLTLGIVRDFGIDISYDGQAIDIRPQSYQTRTYTVEADWSASSYHFALVALAKKARLRLSGLFENSFQGDAAMVSIGEDVGVRSTWEGDSWLLKKGESRQTFTYDFINQPDVAQTIAVICAANKIPNDFSGLKTLRIKETDRIDAMHRELSKIHSSFTLLTTESDDGEHYTIAPGISFQDGIPRFDTYEDHRMAMALAPLALNHPIEINKPEVVTKSYPDFWKDLESLGFEIERIED